MSIQSKNSRFVIRDVVCYFILAMILSPVIPAICQVQEDCENALSVAQTNYETGRFDEGIELLEKCLEKGFTEDQKKLAYRLLGLTYLAKDLEDEAIDAIKKLLEMVPNYEPDMDQDPPPFRNMVSKMQEEMKTEEEKPLELVQPAKKGGGKKWLFIAGGGAVAAIVAAVALGGGGDDGPPPPPPPPPVLPGPPPIPPVP